MDRLLKRQLKHLLANDTLSEPLFNNPEFSEFLQAVDRSYKFNRKELTILERTLELNSEELNTANLKLIKQNKAITELATMDALTGLSNRHVCYERVTQVLQQALEENTRFSLLFIDLDCFKKINDTLGHHVGDELLIQVSQRLMKNIRADDTASRLGGDEFTVILTQVQDITIVTQTANKLLNELAKPYFIEGREINITASIGVGLYPADGKSVKDIFKNSDTAMYHVKENGRNNVELYKPSMQDDAALDQALETALSKAIDNNELSVHYQPKLDTTTHKLCGMEALMRWNNGTHGNVPPSEFIPIAESSGLVNSLGSWILHRSCMQNATWQALGLRPLPVTVNISKIQLSDQHFIQSIDKALEDSGLPPQFLELEITESTIIQSNELVKNNIERLKERGIKLQIDDFGTEFSSLRTLNQFSISTLKIDRSYIRSITSNSDHASIVSAIIAMSKSLKLDIIAVGVEEIEQLTLLTASGCQIVQGFLVSKPLSDREFEELLRIDPDYGRLLFSQEYSKASIR